MIGFNIAYIPGLSIHETEIISTEQLISMLSMLPGIKQKSPFQ